MWTCGGHHHPCWVHGRKAHLAGDSAGVQTPSKVRGFVVRKRRYRQYCVVYRDDNDGDGDGEHDDGHGHGDDDLANGSSAGPFIPVEHAVTRPSCWP